MLWSAKMRFLFLWLWEMKWTKKSVPWSSGVVVQVRDLAGSICYVLRQEDAYFPLLAPLSTQE